MSVQVTINVTGLPPLKAKLQRRQGPELNKALKVATRAAAKALVPGIRAEAPYRTGKLRASVRVGATKRQTPGAYVGPSRKGAFYRGFVIAGTKRGVKPNSFVSRGARAHMPEAERAFFESLKDEVRR